MDSPVPLFFFVCFLLFASPFLAANADVNFDFFYLVLQWPGAYCTQSKCCRPKTGPPADDFSVRGLWAYSTANEKPVTRCKPNTFYTNELDSLRDELNLHWSNLRCPSNNGVSNWRSVWKTYGACTSLNETEYFGTALNLRAKVDVLSLLKKKGITPSLLYIYGKSEIESAIQEGLGVAPQVRCSKGPLAVFQLYEIYICFDKDAETLIECPVKQPFTCSDEIFFTPFNVNNLTSIAATTTAAADRIQMVVEDN